VWWVFGLVAVIVAAVVLAAFMSGLQGRDVPEGLAKANGRIEVERLDIATKYSGRVAEIRVKEGDFVDKGAVVAQLDITELTAQLAAAEANVRRAGQAINRGLAEVTLRQAEHKLSELELARTKELERQKYKPTAELDRRKAQHSVAEANVLAAMAAVSDILATARIPPSLRTLKVEGGGRARPLNAGLEAATGDYVCFLDDDDLVTPDWLAAFARSIQFGVRSKWRWYWADALAMAAWARAKSGSRVTAFSNI